MPDKTVEWLKPGGTARLDLNHLGPAQLLKVKASPLRIASSGDCGRAVYKGPAHRCAPEMSSDRATCLHLALHRAGSSVYSDEASRRDPARDRRHG
jgi:hypothetical protein